MIHLIAAGNPGPYTGPTGNNTWLVDGARPLLVDAGVGEPAHLSALARILNGRALQTIFVTHGHRDHAAGLPQLRKAYPHARVVGADGDVAEDGAWIESGDTRAQIVTTPGHSADHTCLWLPEPRALFGGDLVVRGSSVMISPASGGNLRQYLASLSRVRALQPARIYPGHGPIIDDPEALIDQYFAHRQERELQVIASLEGRASGVDNLIAAIYPDLDPALASAARETLTAHLMKLHEEGRAAEAGGVWHLR